MPTISPQYGVFDLTFDHTFRGVLLTPVNPSVDACRNPGVYLTWLSPTGWMYWLFEGPMEVGKTVTSRGRQRRAGLTTSTQKEGAALITARTANLTREQSEAVATIYESVAVYVLAPDSTNKFHAIPADVDDGTYPVYASRQYVHSLDVQLILPARRSARA